MITPKQISTMNSLDRFKVAIETPLREVQRAVDRSAVLDMAITAKRAAVAANPRAAAQFENDIRRLEFERHELDAALESAINAMQRDMEPIRQLIGAMLDEMLEETLRPFLHALNAVAAVANALQADSASVPSITLVHPLDPTRELVSAGVCMLGKDAPIAIERMQWSNPAAAALIDALRPAGEILAGLAPHIERVRLMRSKAGDAADRKRGRSMFARFR